MKARAGRRALQCIGGGNLAQVGRIDRGDFFYGLLQALMAKDGSTEARWPGAPEWRAVDGTSVGPRHRMQIGFANSVVSTDALLRLADVPLGEKRRESKLVRVGAPDDGTGDSS